MFTTTVAGITFAWPNDFRGLDVALLLAPASLCRGKLGCAEHPNDAQSDDNGIAECRFCCDAEYERT